MSQEAAEALAQAPADATGAADAPQTDPPQTVPVSDKGESAAAETTPTTAVKDGSTPVPTLSLGTPMRKAAKKAMESVASASRKRKSPGKDQAEEAESEPEKKPKRRGRPPKNPAEKRRPGRPPKAVVEKKREELDSADIELAKQVEALSDDIKEKFGNIVWAKMVGFPYWPGVVADPRKLPPKVREQAGKFVDSKLCVYFYMTNNFAWILYKNVESWDDNKFDYRAGHPAKDAKAPKRRTTLMKAIAEADKEIHMAPDDRVGGLLSGEASDDDEEEEPKKSKAKEKEEKPVKEKKKPGRKPKPKPEPAPKEEVEEEPAEEESAGKPSDEAEEDEEADAPAMSKEEIKAKVASKKTPSKKKGDDDAGKSKDGAAKKVKGKPGPKPKAQKEAGEVDTKRKKEIELVVPRKSVKATDIRTITDEAAKKALSKESKVKKDLAEYKVGNLSIFAAKLARLHANESSKNNDEVIRMLNLLFEEKVIYRSDVEQSGLAAIIAALRKSTNPTVAKTASALRKYLMKILHAAATGEKREGAEAEEAQPSKKQKTDEKANSGKGVESASTGKDDTTKQQNDSKSSKAEGSASEKDVKATEDATKQNQDKEKKKTKPEQNGVKPSSPPSKSDSEKTAEGPAKEKGASDDASNKATTPQSDNKPEAQNSNPAEKEKAVKKDAAKDEPTQTTGAAPAKVAPSKSEDKKSKGSEAPTKATSSEPTVDKNRQVFIGLLSKVLDPKGTEPSKVAEDIEKLVFERFNESNEEYKTQARMITFGLKDNEYLLQRVVNGTLHGLELAWANDEFFKTTS
ncbi:TPA: hypothetical protein N0F65_008937 [Lagenidium giganteum]|uniref:PWWP domain-containing protein n=1 Tax=Lagenidium giganteum TaxID=4803 RepID=A0AAV2YU97_9STRA|nr:TPA: hypothetical protein N0F65_008937 [Lagenidium giganteum]